MSFRIRYKGDVYFVRDQNCIGRKCLRLHPIDIRGHTSYGSRSTGRKAYECARRYHFGCPDNADDIYDKDLVSERRKEGYKPV